MLTALGFNFQKGRIRASLLKNENGISFVDRSDVMVDSNLPINALIARYELSIAEILEQYSPDIVSVRLQYKSDKLDSAKTTIMPVAVLASKCENIGKELIVLTSQSFIKPGPFGLTGKIKPIDMIDPLFGRHPPRWDAAQKSSVLAAWRALIDH